MEKYISRMNYIQESYEASKRITFNNIEVINKKKPSKSNPKKE